MYTADQFNGLGDRLTPAAVVPMYTPQEAVEELEFVVKSLGAKAVMLGRLTASTCARGCESQSQKLAGMQFGTTPSDWTAPMITIRCGQSV